MTGLISIAEQNGIAAVVGYSNGNCIARQVFTAPKTDIPELPILTRVACVLRAILKQVPDGVVFEADNKRLIDMINGKEFHELGTDVLEGQYDFLLEKQSVPASCSVKYVAKPRAVNYCSNAYLKGVKMIKLEDLA